VIHRLESTFWIPRFGGHEECARNVHERCALKFQTRFRARQNTWLYTRSSSPFPAPIARPHAPHWRVFIISIDREAKATTATVRLACRPPPRLPPSVPSPFRKSPVPPPPPVRRGGSAYMSRQRRVLVGMRPSRCFLCRLPTFRCSLVVTWSSGDCGTCWCSWRDLEQDELAREKEGRDCLETRPTLIC